MIDRSIDPANWSPGDTAILTDCLDPALSGQKVVVLRGATKEEVTKQYQTYRSSMVSLKRGWVWVHTALNPRALIPISRLRR